MFPSVPIFREIEKEQLAGTALYLFPGRTLKLQCHNSTRGNPGNRGGVPVINETIGKFSHDRIVSNHQQGLNRIRTGTDLREKVFDGTGIESFMLFNTFFGNLEGWGQKLRRLHRPQCGAAPEGIDFDFILRQSLPHGRGISLTPFI
jgi:hypothetical protein